MLKNYHVSWLMQIEAETPEGAARKARQQAGANVSTGGFAFRVLEAKGQVASPREGERIIHVDPLGDWLDINRPDEVRHAH